MITTTESILPENTPTAVLTTSTALLTNLIFLPVVQAATIVGSESVVSESVVSEAMNSGQAPVEAIPVLTVPVTVTTPLTATVPLTTTSELTATASQPPVTPNATGLTTHPIYLPLVAMGGE